MKLHTLTDIPLQWSYGTTMTEDEQTPLLCILDLQRTRSQSSESRRFCADTAAVRCPSSVCCVLCISSLDCDDRCLLLDMLTQLQPLSPIETALASLFFFVPFHHSCTMLCLATTDFHLPNGGERVNRLDTHRYSTGLSR